MCFTATFHGKLLSTVFEGYIGLIRKCLLLHAWFPQLPQHGFLHVYLALWREDEGDSNIHAQLHVCAVKHKPSHVVMTLWKMCWNIHAYRDTLPPPLFQVTSWENKQCKWQDRVAIVFTLHTSNTACDWLWRPSLTHGPVVQLHLERGQTLGLLECVCVSLWLCVCANVAFRFIARCMIVACYALTVYHTTADRN